MPLGHKFDTVDQLLDGLERTAGRLTETVNTPPLDVASLRAEWAELRREVSSVSWVAAPTDRLYSYRHPPWSRTTRYRYSRSFGDWTNRPSVASSNPLPVFCA